MLKLFGAHYLCFLIVLAPPRVSALTSPSEAPKVIGTSSPLHVVSDSGELGDSFTFDSKRWKLRVKKNLIISSDIKCWAQLVYMSKAKQMLVLKEKHANSLNWLRKGDLCLNIEPGNTIFSQVELAGFDDDKPACEAMQRLEVDGLAGIQKELKKNKRLNRYLGEQLKIFLNFFRYPYDNYMPKKLASLLELNSRAFNLKVIAEVENIEKLPKNVTGNAIFISKYCNKFNEAREKFNSTLMRVCYENGFFTGTTPNHRTGLAR